MTISTNFDPTSIASEAHQILKANRERKAHAALWRQKHTQREVISINILARKSSLTLAKMPCDIDLWACDKITRPAKRWVNKCPLFVVHHEWFYKYLVFV